MYKCKCGREFSKKLSLANHWRFCDLNTDRIQNLRNSTGYRTTSEYLVKDGPYISTNHLKSRLINEGYKEWKCERCGLSEWLGDRIPIQIHHKDGDEHNNNLCNLEILCPNCHSLTYNFCGRNKGRYK